MRPTIASEETGDVVGDEREAGPAVCGDGAPRRVGRYEVEAVLGWGAVGVVYLARDPLIGRRVALKTLRRDLDPGRAAELRARFVREAQAAGALAHPNIVTVYDVGAGGEQDDAFIAMELVEGTTLKDRIASGERPAPAEAVELVATLAEALDYAHRAGIVHRDVKPANILLRADGVAKLVDFGIARLEASDLTVDGAVVGTPFYMAPEQVHGEPADSRSDLYALGVVLFELLTGARPFTGRSLLELSLAILDRPAPDPAAINPDVPPPLGRVVQRCLAKQPEVRFQTGAEMAAALRAAIAERSDEIGAETSVARAEPISRAAWADARTEPAPSPERARRAVLVAVAAGLALLVTFVFLTRPQGSPARATSQVAAEPRPTVAPSAKLVLVYVNRLSAARLVVEVDGEELLSEPMSAPRNVFKRIGGDEIQRTLMVPSGRRRITVRVVGTSMSVDARASVVATLVPDRSRRLRAALNAYTDTLKLEWED